MHEVPRVLIYCRYKEKVAKSQDSIRVVHVVLRAAYDAVDAMNSGLVVAVEFPYLREPDPICLLKGLLHVRGVVKYGHQEVPL